MGERDCSRGITLGLFRLLEIYLLVTGKRAGRCGASEGLESAGSYGIDLILGIEWAASPELVDMQDGRCQNLECRIWRSGSRSGSFTGSPGIWSRTVGCDGMPGEADAMQDGRCNDE